MVTHNYGIPGRITRPTRPSMRRGPPYPVPESRLPFDREAYDIRKQERKVQREERKAQQEEYWDQMKIWQQTSPKTGPPPMFQWGIPSVGPTKIPGQKQADPALKQMEKQMTQAYKRVNGMWLLK